MVPSFYYYSLVLQICVESRVQVYVCPQHVQYIFVAHVSSLFRRLLLLVLLVSAASSSSVTRRSPSTYFDSDDSDVDSV